MRLKPERGKQLSMYSPDLLWEVTVFVHIHRCCFVAFPLWLLLLLQNVGVYLCFFFIFVCVWPHSPRGAMDFHSCSHHILLVSLTLSFSVTKSCLTL